MPRKRTRAPNVLFIGRSAWSEHGGIQRFNCRVASALEDVGGRSVVLMILDTPAHVPKSSGRQLFFGFGGSTIKFAAAVLRHAYQADILLLGHINLLPFTVLYRIFRPGGKVILFAHGIEVWNDPRYRPARFYEPMLMRWMINKVAVVSGYTRNLMQKAFSLSADRFELFPNSINMQDRRDPIEDGLPNILVVSRLAESEMEKHVDKVIRALPKVREAVPDASVTIVGDGALRPTLEALASDLGVAQHVQFVGFVSDSELDRTYRRASLFALPSSKEGFGIVYLEAWAKGLPVIASRFGAAPEVVTDGIDGFTIDPMDATELSDRLKDLLTDRKLAAKFADAGWKKLNEQYSDKAFRQRLENLCLHVAYSKL